MKTPIYINRFANDLKLMTKRGRDPENIKAVMLNLIEERPLDRKFRDHVLTGNFYDARLMVFGVCLTNLWNYSNILPQ